MSRCGFLNGGGINGNFFGTAAGEPSIWSTVWMPPPTVKGMKTFSATFSTSSTIVLRERMVAVMSRKTSSSAPLSPESCTELDGVAGVAEIGEMDALDHAVVFYIETRDNSFCKHQAVFL